MAVITQDIPDIQVTVDYPNDQAVFFGITESYGRKIVMTSTCRITSYQIAILPSLLVKVPLAFVYASDSVSKGTIGAKKKERSSSGSGE